MCEAVGHRSRRLHRSRYAGLDVRGLEPGEWRDLTRTEVARCGDWSTARLAAGMAASGASDHS